jgi:hypothetical protein
MQIPRRAEDEVIAACLAAVERAQSHRTAERKLFGGERIGVEGGAAAAADEKAAPRAGAQ